jgi:hypothetical protein
MFFAIILDFWFGKRSVAPQSEKLEPGPITLHHRLKKFQSAIGRMGISLYQLLILFSIYFCGIIQDNAGHPKKRLQKRMLLRVKLEDRIPLNRFLTAMAEVAT